MSTLHTSSSTLHINPMRFDVLILSPHPHFSDEKTEVQGDGAHCQGFRGSQWVSCPPPCCSPGCDLQHKADTLPDSGPPLPPFLPSATLTVFPVGDIDRSCTYAQPRLLGLVFSPGHAPRPYLCRGHALQESFSSLAPSTYLGKWRQAGAISGTWPPLWLL